MEHSRPNGIGKVRSPGQPFLLATSGIATSLHQQEPRIEDRGCPRDEGVHQSHWCSQLPRLQVQKTAKIEPMLPTIARRMASSPFVPPKLRNAGRAPLPSAYAKFNPKKVWPPDFARLSEKEQFRFERRYKRRVKLATARPRWDKYVRLAQLGTVSFVLVYTVLFMDWNTEKQPFQGVRNAFWGTIESLSPSRKHERRTPDTPKLPSEK
ncbi:hypothetical protein GGR57DRAFT_466900 [Xylariaceae sp. FL1272]|nr:hypothetical protein GGR57DRAFT_466900 [Xylariaceae sp. FL1272]